MLHVSLQGAAEHSSGIRKAATGRQAAVMFPLRVLLPIYPCELL